MLKAISKVALLNKYKPTRLIEKIVRGKPKAIEVPNNFCEIGDELEIITNPAGAWCKVVAVLNPKNNHKFSIHWDYLSIIDDEEVEFSLDA